MLFYAKTEKDYFVKKEELLLDDTCLKCPNLIDHLENPYFKRKHTWAISVQNDEELPTVEASFRISKDSQFNQTKAFNLVDLLDIDLIIQSYCCPCKHKEAIAKFKNIARFNILHKN